MDQSFQDSPVAITSGPKGWSFIIIYCRSKLAARFRSSNCDLGWTALHCGGIFSAKMPVALNQSSNVCVYGPYKELHCLTAAAISTCGRSLPGLISAYPA
jgi:hypothetical protein